MFVHSISRKFVILLLGFLQLVKALPFAFDTLLPLALETGQTLYRDNNFLKIRFLKLKALLFEEI